MKYDNPKIRDIIDGCVEKIREEPDEEFFRYVNTARRWELRLAQDLYVELAKSPSNCFTSLEPAMRYLVKVTGCDDYLYKENSNCIMHLDNSTWSLSANYMWADYKFCFSVFFEDDYYQVGNDNNIPAGVILAINYHFPYIREKALDLKRETEKRQLIHKIEEVTEQHLG